MTATLTPETETIHQIATRLVRERRRIVCPYPKNSLAAMWFNACRSRTVESIKASHAETRRYYSSPTYMSSNEASEMYAEAAFVRLFEPGYAPYPVA